MQQVTHHVSKLRYLKTLVNSTLNRFSQEPDKEMHTVPSADPFVYCMRKDFYSLGAGKIDVNVKPVFTSRKMSQTLSFKENKTLIVSPQCVVQLFQL